MENEVQAYYEELTTLYQTEELPLLAAYRRLRELLERICRTQMEGSQLQMTDLSARINYVAVKGNLSVAEQNRLHTFRLTCNHVLNYRAQPNREQLLRDAKSIAFCIKKLFGMEIPEALYRLLPRADATYQVSPPAQERVKRMRVCYLHADDNYLYVQPTEHIGEEPLRVRYNVPQVNEEFSATCQLLWHHAQLNLLDVDIDAKGILTPSFIILEPDYLVDISSLAECFKEYGSHPLNYTFARLQPSENTRALLLGNIANLFLDEWIHAKEEEPTYLECMKKAFRQYALELAACPDLRDRELEKQFFADCRLHFENIRQTVQETFQASGYCLDRTDAVLEPSYICEALGLQGRLDYMQRDLASFIEMKSGKADEYSFRGKIEPKENNKVQMLLYQAVLEYNMGRDHRHVHAYLFYTRYPLLYPARSSWAMVRRVMDVRNRIVAGEYGIQLHNSPSFTASQLAAITPESLNERGLNNVLWKRYLAPAIGQWGEQLQALSPLERDYFHTLYNFITKELYTSKSGDMEYEGRKGAASLWLDSLEEKLDSGAILTDLQITEHQAADLQQPHLCLCRKQEEQPAPECRRLPDFRTGDAIVLYQRNTPEDNVTNKLVFKGSIEQISEEAIRIRLRAPQRNRAVLPMESLYAIEHDATMETSFRSMYQGLSAFLQATERRRSLLLCRREPEFDPQYFPAIDATEDDFQRITLKAQAARDYFLLVGPPGTGKTSRALRSMVEAFLKEGKQLLLLSYTNRAVDEICKTLTAIAPAVDFIRMGSELACETCYRPYLMESVLAACNNRREVQERINRCPIFVGTVSTLSSRQDLFRLKQFDVAIVDEATQILEPQLLGLFCLRTPEGTDAIGKFILIGDHKQLPAVVLQAAAQSEVSGEELRSIGLLNLKDSLFERLYRRQLQQASGGAASTLASRSFDMLCRQGRMNPAVADFPNRAFYNNRLRSIGLPHQQGELLLANGLEADEFNKLLTQRVAFLPSQPESAAGSIKQNHSEAEVAVRLATALYHQYRRSEGFDPLRTLGIITPYRSQIALIRSKLEQCGIEELAAITVDTVERYQGSERDVIIYSFCVNQTYQLKQLSNLTEENGVQIDRKLNVAMTRARKQLFLTGVPGLLQLNPIYKALLESLQQL